jgi:hypothetical protein
MNKIWLRNMTSYQEISIVVLKVYCQTCIRETTTTLMFFDTQIILRILFMKHSKCFKNFNCLPFLFISLKCIKIITRHFFALVDKKWKRASSIPNFLLIVLNNHPLIFNSFSRLMSVLNIS